MEIIQNNSLSDLIYLFLDGEADSTQQDLLFKNLADNPELQSEFQDAVTLNKSLSADSKNLVPSNELTHNLFVKAGFESGAAGSGVTGIVSETTRNTVLSGIIGKIKSSIIPASIGSVITAALLTTGMYLLDIDFHSDGRAAVNQGGTQRQAVTQNENTIPVVKSESVHGVDKSNQLSNVIRRRAVPVFSENIQTTPENNVETVTENTLETTENIPVIFIPDIQPSDLVQMNDKPELSYRNNDFIHLNTPPSVGFGDLSIPTKLNVLRKLNDNNYIGFSGGNEILRMYEVVEDSNGINFLNQPNMAWGGIIYRGLSDKIEILGNLQLIFDCAVGFSKLGYLVKPVAGLYYNPENSFTLGLGIEGTGLLFYNTRSDTKGTGKIALVYSFGYNF